MDSLKQHAISIARIKMARRRRGRLFIITLVTNYIKTVTNLIEDRHYSAKSR